MSSPRVSSATINVSATGILASENPAAIILFQNSGELYLFMFARFCSQNSWYWFLVALFLGAFCGGCSNQGGLDPVRGKVLYKNEPLAGAMVAFHPEGGTSMESQPVTGLTKDDGTFSLTTGQVDGAEPGKYVVTVVCMVPEKTEEKPGAIMMGMPETKDRFEGKFANRDSSKISVEIRSGQTELEPIKLE